MINNYDNHITPNKNLVEKNNINSTLYKICLDDNLDALMTLSYDFIVNEDIVNWTDSYGNNCIMIGLEANASDELLLNLLSSTSLNIRQENVYKRTIFLKACFKGRLNINIVKNLVHIYQTNNWNLNEVDINQFNPYLAACVSDNVELIEYLETIDSIDKYSKNRDEKDAFLIASQYDSINVVKYLFKKEVNSYDGMQFLSKLQEAIDMTKTHFYQIKTRQVSAFLNQQYKLLQEIDTIENMFKDNVDSLSELPNFNN